MSLSHVKATVYRLSWLKALVQLLFQSHMGTVTCTSGDIGAHNSSRSSSEEQCQEISHLKSLGGLLLLHYPSPRSYHWFYSCSQPCCDYRHHFLKKYAPRNTTSLVSHDLPEMYRFARYIRLMVMFCTLRGYDAHCVNRCNILLTILVGLKQYPTSAEHATDACHILTRSLVQWEVNLVSKL
jgi:hypothetical protein